MSPKGVYKHHPYGWTDEEIAILRENAGKLTQLQISMRVRHSKSAVGWKMLALGLKGFRDGRPGWSAERIEALRREGPTMSRREFCLKYGLKKECVRETARKHGVTFANSTVPGLWSAEEIAQLRELAPTCDRIQAAAKLGRSYKSVQMKARELDLAFVPHVRPKKVRAPRPPKPPRAPRPVKQAAPPKPQAPKIKPRKVVPEVSRIQYCPKCKAPVSNQEQHLERMPQCGPQIVLGADTARYMFIPLRVAADVDEVYFGGAL